MLDYVNRLRRQRFKCRGLKPSSRVCFCPKNNLYFGSFWREMDYLYYSTLTKC
jgi:hypothetical protein